MTWKCVCSYKCLTLEFFKLHVRDKHNSIDWLDYLVYEDELNEGLTLNELNRRRNSNPAKKNGAQREPETGDLLALSPLETLSSLETGFESVSMSAIISPKESFRERFETQSVQKGSRSRELSPSSFSLWGRIETWRRM